MATAQVVGSYHSKKLVDLALQLRLNDGITAGFMSVDGNRASQHQDRSELWDLGRRNDVKARRAAVLICIFEGENGELRVILTKRALTLSSHSGEVCLPGGKVEEVDECDVATALREAKEEIGLDPSLVDVIAVLEPFRMKNGMIVVPVIGLLHEKSTFHPKLNADEVEDIFDAPLEMFLENKNRREEEKEWNHEKYLLHFFDYKATNGETYVIFALTAGILIEAASIVYQRSPSFRRGKRSF